MIHFGILEHLSGDLGVRKSRKFLIFSPHYFLIYWRTVFFDEKSAKFKICAKNESSLKVIKNGLTRKMWKNGLMESLFSIFHVREKNLIWYILAFPRRLQSALPLCVQIVHACTGKVVKNSAKTVTSIRKLWRSTYQNRQTDLRLVGCLPTNSSSFNSTKFVQSSICFGNLPKWTLCKLPLEALKHSGLQQLFCLNFNYRPFYNSFYAPYQAFTIFPNIF